MATILEQQLLLTTSPGIAVDQAFVEFLQAGIEE